MTNGSFTYKITTHGTMSASVIKKGPSAAYSGLTKQANSSGTMTESQATAGTDYYAPGSTDVAITDGGTGSSTANGGLDALNANGEATVASAATTDLGALTSQKVSITGTATISSFGTAAAGTVRMGRFTGIALITHNATSLIIPGGRSVSTTAGDTFTAVSLGSGNWAIYNYTRASGGGLGVLTGTVTWDPGNLTNGSTEDKTAITVTGAAVGDPCVAMLSSVSVIGWRFDCVVTATDTVTVRITNGTGGTSNLGSGTLTVKCFK
jgi:hypothetical protein